MKLHSLSDIFERRLLRIPDYQRGYAWNEHQLEDFWEDILQLEVDRVHYTGVITLEPVASKHYQRWDQDLWLIEGVGFRPFYVVDGQQRLTTSMILLQAIIESVPDNAELNYQSIESIRKQFIFFKADNNIQQSFVFGYEKDNPSDEFLKTKVFMEQSESNQFQETLYTRNLINAKEYFLSKLKPLSFEQKTDLYKKLTQKFKFNLYEIDDEIDVFVTFETMNNRGKPLTSLELLKNRLIYLSTQFSVNDGREQLRSNINDAWKTMYEFLGKNPEKALDDNLFLRNHWIMYFKYTRNKGDDYVRYLLDEKFNVRNVTHPKSDELRLKIEEIQDYVRSLKNAVVHWFYLHNPYHPMATEFSDTEKEGLDRLDRLGFKAFKPLILASLLTIKDKGKRAILYSAMERFIFTAFTLSQRKSNTGDSRFYQMARELLTGALTIETVLSKVYERTDRHYDPAKFLEYIKDVYKFEQSGFYHWDGSRYVLFEYENWLQKRGKHGAAKLTWQVVKANKKDHVSVEHIYPQQDTDPYWKERFGHLSVLERRNLTHSLGNLLPLSRAKNSSLQNDAFPIKVNGGQGVGYYNGSVSENEVAQYPDWTPTEILKRGLELLRFMEERWDIELGDFEFKRKLLHLDQIEFASAEIKV